MKTKLLFINPIQFGYSAGHYHYCKYLVDYYDITFLCLDQGFAKIELNNVNTIYLNNNDGSNRIKRQYLFIKHCIKLIRENKFSCVFVVSFIGALFIPIFSKHKNTIIDIRTGAIENNQIKVFLLNKLYSFQARFFDKIMVLSNGLKEILQLPSKKTTVISLGADCISTLEKKYDNTKLLYVGTLYNRNIEETIIGVKKYVDKYGRCGVEYDIVGFGYGKEEELIQRCILEYELKDIVKFHGRKNYNELEAYFDSANIGIAYIPDLSVFRNQPATKIFEYALSGLFTIATNVQENLPLINSKNGVIINDNADGVCLGLKYFRDNKENLDFSEISNSLQSYHWKNIAQNELKKLIDATNF